MNPNFLGDPYDFLKRQTMKWLAPNESWFAHPMWYSSRPERPDDHRFLYDYAVALDVGILPGESRHRNEFLESARTCTEHLLLDPDTGLKEGNRTNRHVTLDEFVQIVTSLNRQAKLTVIYDHSYFRNGQSIWQQTKAKLRALQNREVHSVAYMAHEGNRVRLIWASSDYEIITEVTRRMQRESHFPARRFVDDGFGHVRLNNAN